MWAEFSQASFRGIHANHGGEVPESAALFGVILISAWNGAESPTVPDTVPSIPVIHRRDPTMGCQSPPSPLFSADA